MSLAQKDLFLFLFAFAEVTLHSLWQGKGFGRINHPRVRAQGRRFLFLFVVS